MRKSLKMQIPSDLKKIHLMMKSSGHELYVVGGAVRDTLMNKIPKDFDLATDADPKSVTSVLSQDDELRIDLTGKSFGVIRVKTPIGSEYEIATFRKDIGSGRRPDSVEFTTIENDVLRRDLTINALFYDMDTSEVVDLVGGIEDIENGVIRAVGKPSERFKEDKLRILRAARFAGRMGSDLHPETKQSILDDNSLDEVTPERIRDEFIKGLSSSKDISHFLSIVDELGLFPQIFPNALVNVSNVVSSTPVVQIALLLIGNDPVFIRDMLRSMKYSRNEISTISFLLSLLDLGKESAPRLKKEFNRIKIPEDQILDFASASGEIDKKIISGFLKFATAQPRTTAQELISQGFKGADIGIEMNRLESEAYESSINELRSLIRMVINESNNVSLGPSSEIYCDMDGVLVDFVSGALKVCSSILDGTFGAEWVSSSKTMRKSIKQINQDLGPGWRPTTKNDLDIPAVRNLMFSAISFSPGDFFSNLGPLQDGVGILWAHLNSTGLTVNILSAPVGRRASAQDAPSAGQGKLDWTNEWLSPVPSEVIIRSAKRKPDFALAADGSPNVLIDDKASTIDSWNSRGGIGVLHIPGNSRATIEKLRSMGI